MQSWCVRAENTGECPTFLNTHRPRQVVCLVVQAVKIGYVGLSTEFITMNGYGMLMAAATALAVPMAMGSLYRILVLHTGSCG